MFRSNLMSGLPVAVPVLLVWGFSTTFLFVFHLWGFEDGHIVLSAFLPPWATLTIGCWFIVPPIIISLLFSAHFIRLAMKIKIVKKIKEDLKDLWCPPPEVLANFKNMNVVLRIPYSLLCIAMLLFGTLIYFIFLLPLSVMCESATEFFEGGLNEKEKKLRRGGPRIM